MDKRYVLMVGTDGAATSAPLADKHPILAGFIIVSFLLVFVTMWVGAALLGGRSL